MNNLGRSTVDASDNSWVFVGNQTTQESLSTGCIKSRKSMRSFILVLEAGIEPARPILSYPRILSPDAEISKLPRTQYIFKMFSFSGPKYGRRSWVFMGILEHQNEQITRLSFLLFHQKGPSDLALDSLHGWQL
jgi:hypothetical protein